MANIISLLGLSAPTGMWAKIINWIYSFASNYGLTIILLTLFIKIVMSPLDFWQKYTQKSMQISQAKMAPELEALNKRYAYDKQLLNQKTMQVYKKHGVSPMGSFFSMIINLVIVLVVFITLINSMNKMSNYKAQKQFYDLQGIYYATYEDSIDAGKTTDESTLDAQAAVEYAFYHNKGIKENFLWIKNIWRRETNQSVIPQYKDVNATEFKKQTGFYDQTSENYVSEEEYNKIMGALQEKTKGQWNGYYILTILVVGLTWLSSFIISYKPKSERVAGGPQAANASRKITSFIMPAFMGIFTLTASSTFALYLVTSQLIAIIINLIQTPIINKIIKKKEAKRKEETTPKVSYSR